jgi:hypothetical protein
VSALRKGRHLTQERLPMNLESFAHSGRPRVTPVGPHPESYYVSKSFKIPDPTKPNEIS